MDNLIDSNGQGSANYAPKVKSILELLTSHISSSQLYTICAKFYASQNNNRLSLSFAQKAYRAALNNPEICEKNIIFKQLCHVTLGLVEAYVLLGPMMEEVRMGGSEEMVCKDWM